MKQITLIVLGWIVLSFTAQAASFDCAKAATKVEKLICGDAALSKLDEELSAAYKTALQDGAQADTVKQAQKQWMKERNGCADVGCVQSAYRKRIEQLHPFQNAPAKPRQETNEFKYRMIQGSGHAICELIFKRMNQELVSNRQVCAFDLLTAIPGVVLPEWKKLALEENKLLYIRFLLANLVREKNYAQVFSEQPSGSGKSVEDIRIPKDDQLMYGKHVTGDQLEKMWKDAIAHRYEFYRWDGVIPVPDDTDVLLVELSRFDEPRGQESCPKFRLLRISADMRMPKPWRPVNSTWLVGPESISFKYENQYYRLTEQLSEAKKLSNEVSIDAIRDDSQCLIQGNIFFPPQ